MQCQSAWDVIKWSIHLDPPRDETTTVEEDRGRSCQTMYPSLLLALFLRQPFLLALSLFLFLSRWLRRQPPPFNLSAYNLPTYCIYLPTKLILQKEEGKQFVGPGDAYLTQHLHLWYLRNVLSSFILGHLFNRSASDNRVSRCAHFYCPKLYNYERIFESAILWHRARGCGKDYNINLSLLK